MSDAAEALLRLEGGHSRQQSGGRSTPTTTRRLDYTPPLLPCSRNGFRNPKLVEIEPAIAPPNTLRLRSVMFTVESVDDTVARLRDNGASDAAAAMTLRCAALYVLRPLSLCSRIRLNSCSRAASCSSS